MFAAYYLFIKRFIAKPIYNQIKPIFKLRKNLKNKLTYLIWTLLLAGAVSFVVYDSWNEKSRLISGGGLFCLIFLGFIFSVSRRLKRLIFGKLMINCSETSNKNRLESNIMGCWITIRVWIVDSSLVSWQRNIQLFGRQSQWIFGIYRCWL